MGPPLGARPSNASIAAENGATESQLMAVFGWTSAKQASHYTKKGQPQEAGRQGDGLDQGGVKQVQSVQLFRDLPF